MKLEFFCATCGSREVHEVPPGAEGWTARHVCVAPPGWPRWAVVPAHRSWWSLATGAVG